ncbi:MAG: hypothetical protein Q9160_004886 [Pyrenula sp. 1 TL-2023]
MTSRYISHLRNWALSSPPAEWIINQIRELLIGSLRRGPVPQHIAFVMDGNRRYARKHRIETVEGHNLGFEALARILEVCYKSGVRVVTIYAFSTENFKRSKYEVDHLMEMAKVKLIQFAQHGDLLDRYGACIRILGQRELVKPDVLEAIDKAVDMTKNNGQAVLNICFPYASRDEITTAIRNTVIEFSTPLEKPSTLAKSPFSESRIAYNIRTQNSPRKGGDQDRGSLPNTSYLEPPAQHTHGSEPLSLSRTSSATSISTLSTSTNENEKPLSPAGSSSTTLSPTPNVDDFDPPSVYRTQYPSPDSITPDTLTSHTYTATCPPLDLLIRTSGVSRLSDFMLWQCHQETEIVFLPCLWPEMDLWGFLPVIWGWQRRQVKREKEGHRFSLQPSRMDRHDKQVMG